MAKQPVLVVMPGWLETEPSQTLRVVFVAEYTNLDAEGFSDALKEVEQSISNHGLLLSTKLFYEGDRK